jgi:hypothetical protein
MAVSPTSGPVPSPDQQVAGGKPAIVGEIAGLAGKIGEQHEGEGLSPLSDE